MGREGRRTFSDKAYDLLKDMVMTYTKKEFAIHLEKHVTRRVKKELRKEFASLGAVTFLFIGMGFFIYALFGLVVQLLELPSTIAQLVFGTFLIFIALILYVFRP